MLKDYHIKHYNFILILLILVATGFGTIIIYSADSTYLNKQLIGLVGCLGLMLIVSLIDYRIFCKYMWVLYGFGILMLLFVEFFGKNVNGATRWIAIGSSMTLQPSEFEKIILIICVAVFLEKHKEDLNKFKTLCLLALMCAIPLVLIEEQPDLSTTLDIIIILLVVIFTAGLSYKIIGVTILILIPICGSFVWYIQTPNQLLLEPYQYDRVMSFLYPQDYLLTTGYQQYNSVMAIGSGMLSGKGLNSSTIATVKEANFISEQQTDFIFSVIGEELGFIGSVFIIIILALIVFQCIKTARKAQDLAGTYIATGVAAIFAVQTFINVGVATAILPNTGLPLPLVSYGLSSLLSSCVGLGLVLNISLQRKKY